MTSCEPTNLTPQITLYVFGEKKILKGAKKQYFQDAV